MSKGDLIISFNKEISQLKEQIKSAREVIEFYGIENNWEEFKVDWGRDGMSGWTLDTGRKAREWLEKNKED